MSKRDSIFWYATGIFVLSLVLVAVTQNQFWLGLMLASYLLRPTLASLGVTKATLDERQMSINYRSGNIAFAVTLIVCVIFMGKLEMAGNHDFEYFAAAAKSSLALKCSASTAYCWSTLRVGDSSMARAIWSCSFFFLPESIES